MLTIFSPTVLLLLTIPLWYCKKVSNEALNIIAYCCLFIPTLLLLLFLILKEPIEELELEYVGVILSLSLLMLLANTWQFFIYRKKLRNNRCPLCRKLSRNMTKRTEDEYANTRTKIYQNGRFMQRSPVLKPSTTYNSWCPQCKETFSCTDPKTGQLDIEEKRGK